jgi:hypothetical protein
MGELALASSRLSPMSHAAGANLPVRCGTSAQNSGKGFAADANGITAKMLRGPKGVREVRKRPPQEISTSNAALKGAHSKGNGHLSMKYIQKDEYRPDHNLA